MYLVVVIKAMSSGKEGLEDIEAIDCPKCRMFLELSTPQKLC